MAGLVVSGTQVSYIGQDCREIPEHLSRDCGHFAKRLDLSFNLLSLSGPTLDTCFISLEAQYNITVYYASSKCTGRAESSRRVFHLGSCAICDSCTNQKGDRSPVVYFLARSM
ncbi:hypothetical protein E5288_WYG016434 [Bos mutus]|uniref:Uncharacterized protein n=1 Tax=Bos mutus TaxID=72004 RepID=A0A6B0R7D0_9CETA|nr:hypothetical protein [Bos mutus]